MAKVREIAWPDEYSDLKRMEELMVCGICYEYMETTVITPCSHNYCSLCIRKYLHYKAQCPACFQVFFEKDLYINRVMDSLIQYYLQIREKVVSLVENRAVYNKIKGEPIIKQEPPNTPNTPPVRPARNNQLPRSPKVLDVNTEPKIKEPKTPSAQSPFASTSKCSISSPSSPSTFKSISSKDIPTIAHIFNTPKRKVVNIRQVEKPKLVPCPVCKVEIPEYTVNLHLDACLQRENQEKIFKEKEKLKEKMTKKRQPLPKLVLRVMKDAELRKKMKELGLSTQGDRRALEIRFTRYTTIYNSECDKIQPRPVVELIKQCEAEERQERHMTSFLVSAAALQRLQIEKNAKEDKIEEAQKNYRTNHKSSFDKLVEEIRNRKKLEKEKLVENQQNDEAGTFTNESSTSANIEKVSENISENDENSSFNPSAEIAFQDSNSDSDQSCLLQHYENINGSSSCASTSTSPVKRPQRTRNSNRDKTKESRSLQVTNPYEMPTDESTDDDVPRSPISNTNMNRKRAKLNDKLLNKSCIYGPSTSKSINEDSTENQNKEAVARDLCNSIIHDFSCDDSSNEFADKPQKQANVIEEVKINGNCKINDSSQCDLKEINSSFSDKKVPEINLNEEVLTNNLSNALDDFSVEFMNDNDFNDYLDSLAKCHDDSKCFDEKVNQTVIPNHNTDDKVEKENDAATANENAPSFAPENTSHRPVRKRNRPVRYTDDQSDKQEDNDKIINKETDELYNSESPDNIRSSASSDSSLKRRRGRPKAGSTDHPSDELQNPPKRPVRRRQGASDRNL